MPTSIAGLSAFLASGRFMVTTMVWPSPLDRQVLGAAHVGSPLCPTRSERVLLRIVEFNLADLFEAAVDAFGDREYLVAEGQRRTYAEMEERANRLAHHLADQGVGPGDHVGIYAYNSVEWVEALWAIFKIRAVWININYRYVADELAYLVRERRPGRADLPAGVRAPGRGGQAATAAVAPLHRRGRRQRRRRPPGRRSDRLGRLRGARWPRAGPTGTSSPAPPTTATSSSPAARPGCRRAWCGGTRTSSSPWAAASTRSPTSG